MRNYIKKIRDNWFVAVTPQRLALLRIATGCFSLWYLLSRFDMLQRIASSNTEIFNPIGILNWMDQPLPPQVFWWITVGLILLNILFIIGWKFKFTGPAFAVLVLFFFTYRNSWSMIYHNRNGLILHIIILGLVASADAWSWDASKRAKKGHKPKAHWQYGWPILLICAATVGTYLLAGVAKLAGGLALEWANGSAMRSQIAVDAIRKEMLGSEAAPLFELLYQHTWLFLGMGILTFVLELGAPLAMVKRRWGMIWAALTWTMHWGIFFIMGITFRYQMSGLMFLSFFDLEKLWNPSKKELAGTFSKKEPVEISSKPVVLFDGVCNLCNGWIGFILKREKNQLYQFASLQSETGKKLLGDHNISEELSSIVLIEEGNVYQKSDAVLRICKNLNAPWPLYSYLLVVPNTLRDRMYDFVATNRYKWFGKQEQCDLMQADQKVRFLDL